MGVFEAFADSLMIIRLMGAALFLAHLVFVCVCVLCDNVTMCDGAGAHLQPDDTHAGPAGELPEPEWSPPLSN